MFQVFIRMDMNGKNTIIISDSKLKFNANSTVGDLYQRIKDKEGLDTSNLRLMYGGKQMDMSRKACQLHEFGIQNQSTLHGMLRLPGGTQPNPVQPSKRDDVKFDDEKVKSINLNSEKAECSICWDNTKVVLIHKKGNEKHQLCSKCMYSQCRANVWNGDTSIKCPVSCSHKIPMKIAFTVAGFTKKEWETYELRLNMNALPFKACPNDKCGIFIFREFDHYRVRCPKCNLYPFCWSCLKKWKGKDDWLCGNDNCNSVALLIKQINDAWEERKNSTISGINGVPKIRLCPNYQCRAVNEHLNACKHMTCGKGTKYGCKHNYCQSCLKPWNGCKCAYCELTKPKEYCPGLSSNCTVHPLQKVGC